ncbi:MAG: spermidine/putrescine ABC transporter substrate-binding protein [Anaerolineae bacterium]
MRRLCVLWMILLAACSPQAAPTLTPSTGVPISAPSPTVAAATPASATTPQPTSRLRDAVERAVGWHCPADFSGQTLRVYNWSTYIADDTIEHFETLCNVNVTYTEFDSEDAMLAEVRANPTGYDIIVPSNTTLPLLAQENLLSALNLANIPNLANLSATLLSPLYDEGNRYSVPYQWGTIGVGYNIERTRQQIVSWHQLFDYQGPVAWLNENSAMMGIALSLIGYNPSTSNPQEIANARDYLIARSLNVSTVADDVDGQDLLANGTVDMVVEYSGDIFQIMADCACDTFHYAIPREGTMRWVDNLAVTAGVQNQALAEAFIDYILQPAVGASVSNFTAYASPNQTAINMGLIDDTLLTNSAIYPDAATEGKLFFVQRSPESEALYTEAWQAVLDAIAQRQAAAGQ